MTFANENAESLLCRSASPGFRALTMAKDGSQCLAMEYGGERSLNDLIEQRREEGLKAFPVANIEKVALHMARALRVNRPSSSQTGGGGYRISSNSGFGIYLTSRSTQRLFERVLYQRWALISNTPRY